MNLARLYSQLIGTCEERNGKPRRYYGAKQSKKGGYEIHHIHPRSLPGYIGSVDHPSNLVYMSYREHFLAHHILTRLYHDEPIAAAYARMCHSGNYRITSRQYQTAREAQRLIVKLANTGKEVSPETRQKLSQANRGRKHTREARARMGRGNGWVMSDEQKQAIGEAIRGRICSKETRKKIGDANRGRPQHPNNRAANALPKTDEAKANMSKSALNRAKYPCPICGVLAGAAMLKRWHGDNCKHRPS
ncbi:hypothetical protein ABFK60_001219 [Escherichia coli O13/129/135:H4]